MFAGFTVQWTDIDLYHAYRDFTTDPVSFPPEEVASFISDLVSDILGVIALLCLIESSHTDREQPILYVTYWFYRRLSSFRVLSQISQSWTQGSPSFIIRRTWSVSRLSSRKPVLIPYFSMIHSPGGQSSTFIHLILPPYPLICCRDVWVKNPDGSLYIGEVWPGYTVRLIALYLVVSDSQPCRCFPTGSVRTFSPSGRMH